MFERRWPLQRRRTLNSLHSPHSTLHSPGKINSKGPASADISSQQADHHYILILPLLHILLLLSIVTQSLIEVFTLRTCELMSFFVLYSKHCVGLCIEERDTENTSYLILYNYLPSSAYL